MGAKQKTEMKKLLVLLCSIYSGLTVAQISLENNYTGFFPPKDPTAVPRMNRWMIDLFHDDFRMLPEGIVTRPYSFGINVTRFIEFPLNKGNNFSFAFGVSFSSHNVHSNGFFNTTLDSVSGEQYTSLDAFTSSASYKRNKVSLNFIDIPFQLRFRTNKKNNFFFFPGFKVGYLFNDHTTFVDESGKYKHYNTFGLMRFRYGPSVHLGLNRISLFGFYSLTPVFLKNKGDEFYLISAGLSFNFF